MSRLIVDGDFNFSSLSEEELQYIVFGVSNFGSFV